MSDQRALVRTPLLTDFFIGCSVLLLAWAIVFGAALNADASDARLQLVTNAALVVLSSTGTMTSALWLKRQRHVATGMIELFLLVFVVLGAVGAWSATARADVFRAIYLIVLLASLYVVKRPIERPRGASVRIVSACVFGAIAVGHIMRLVAETPVAIGWWSVPEWISVVAVCAAGILALWNWRDRRSGGEARIP